MITIVSEEEDVDHDYVVEHQIMSITSYLDSRLYHTKASNEVVLQKGDRYSDLSSLEQHAEHGTAVRCPKPDPNANFCCAQWSDEQEEKIGVCGPNYGIIYMVCCIRKKKWTE